MKKKKCIIAVVVVISMMLQAFIPVMAETAEDGFVEEYHVEPIEESVVPVPEVPEIPEVSDVPSVSDIPDYSDIQDGEPVAELPDTLVPDGTEIPDQDPSSYPEPAEDYSEGPGSDYVPGEGQVPADVPANDSTAPAATAEISDGVNTSAENEHFDVSEPDSNLWDYYVAYDAGAGNEGQNLNNSSVRGLNLSNKEPVELKGYNFILFGLSGHNSGDDDRSDTIMIITVDPDRQEIKLTSILRDTKAAITGHEPQKINAAYKYGGAELAVETINKNFSLALDQYVTVDFRTLEDIVDLLGGVDIELSPEEVEFINTYSTEPVVEGLNTLNGEQALLYCRIRKTDSDTVRAGRQQRVIQEILSRLKGCGLLDWLRVLIKVIETSEISMPILDIIKVISLPLATYKMVNNIIPDIEYETDLTSMIDEHGEWVWIYDLEKAGDRIVDIINNQ